MLTKITRSINIALLIKLITWAFHLCYRKLIIHRNIFTLQQPSICSTASSLCKFLAVLCSTVFLSACLAAAVGTVVITSIDVAHERRSVGAYIDDSAIELKAKQHLLRNKDIRGDTHLNVTSMNGIVLLTGESKTPELKRQVIDYIQQINGVRQVIDEATISGKTGIISRTNDGWLTTKVKTKLYAKTGFDANRVKVVTEHGSVYLLGLVTQSEGDKAVNVVRRMNGVVRVVKVFEYTD